MWTTRHWYRIHARDKIMGFITSIVESIWFINGLNWINVDWMRHPEFLRVTTQQIRDLWVLVVVLFEFSQSDFDWIQWNQKSSFKNSLS